MLSDDDILDLHASFFVVTVLMQVMPLSHKWGALGTCPQTWELDEV